jgi:hypothetical protein
MDNSKPVSTEAEALWAARLSIFRLFPQPPEETERHDRGSTTYALVGDPRDSADRRRNRAPPSSTSRIITSLVGADRPPHGATPAPTGEM